MRFNEWLTFIKESRNWCASKCRSADCCLIERRDDDDDDDDDDDSADKARAMNLLRYLWNESMRILLTSWISAWHHMREVTSDCAYCMREVVEKEDCSWFWMNFYNVRWLWLIWARWKQI